jgi:hypothetical protein
MGFSETTVNFAPTYNQATAPSSPRVGETWIERDASNNIVNTWEWNGVIWLSQQIYALGGQISASSLTSGSLTQVAIRPSINVFIVSMDIVISLGATHNGSNYFNFRANRRTRSVNTAQFGVVATTSAAGSPNTVFSSGNVVFNTLATDISLLSIDIFLTGSPTTAGVLGSMGLLYREARP